MGGAGATDLRIKVTRFSRFVALSRAFIPLLLAITLVTLGFEQNADESLSADERSDGIVGGLIVGGLLGWYGVRLLRPVIVRRPRVDVGPDHLTIRHNALFKEPLRLPRELVRLVAVDARPGVMRWFRDHPRFHLTEGEGAPAWLWSKKSNSPLPLLSHVGDIPNAAILFTAPVELARVRRGIRPFPTRGPVHMPKRGQKARGMLVRFRDPEVARRAFSEWGVVRPLTIDDIAPFEPPADERKAARKRRRWSNAILTTVLIVEAAAPLLAEPSEAHRAAQRPRYQFSSGGTLDQND